MSFLEKVAAAVQKNVDVGFYDQRPNKTNKVGKKSLLLALNQFTLIAEIKPASPSSGKLFDGDMGELAESYKAAGAGAISVLCEPTRFGGTPANIVLAKKTGLPVLAKDFVVSEKQLDAYTAYGADAVLLIAELFERKKTDVALDDMIAAAHARQLNVLLEFHDERLLHTCLSSKADVLGVNNRNLDDLSMNPMHYQNVMDPRALQKKVVAESGFADKKDVDLAKELGFAGVLMGTALLKSENPGAALAGLK